jgi:polar amino acid transport system substrate-binding protein
MNSDPFATYEAGQVRGVEPRILERFAEELDAEIEWFPGTEEELMGALELRELDVVIGGLTSTNPWSKMVTLTHPYLTTAVVVGSSPMEEALEDIAGVEVLVEPGSDAAGILEKTDAEVVYVEDVEETVLEAKREGRVTFQPAEIAAAVDNWLLDDLDLADTGVRLIENDHVMAMPFGENAWLVRLERFLLTHEDDIKSILEEEGRP